MKIHLPNFRLPTLEPRYKNRFFRVRFMVYPRFQLTLILINFIALFSVAIVMMVYASRVFERLYSIGRGMRLPPDDGYFRFLQTQANSLYSNIGIAAMIGLLMTFVLTLMVSHKLAGPIIRIMGYFKQVKEDGEVKNRLTFRDGDYFGDLPELVNEALETIAPKKKK